MALEFSQKTLQEIKEILKRFPTKMAASLPVLHLAQRDFGYINDEIIEYIAGLLDVTPAEVHSVVSFYTMFYRKETGKYIIQLCQTLSCSLLGTESIVEHIKKKLGIGPGETTPDKRFSLVKVECLGSCGTAPVMRINDDYFENLTIQKINEIIDNLP